MKPHRRLSDIAHGRSGDKGNHANIAILAYDDAGHAWLREHLTAEAVARYFAPIFARSATAASSASRPTTCSA